jgi:predicted nucleic acid-binding protein
LVIIDTSIWISAFARRNSIEKEEVERLTSDDEAAIVGTILLELLRGARSPEEFEKLSGDLKGASFVEDTEESWTLAGRILLELRAIGQTIPIADAVIAAQAMLGEHTLYTADPHFGRISGLRLHKVI